MASVAQNIPEAIRLPPRSALRRQRGFDFTSHVRHLCNDLTSRLPALRHIDMSRVAISYAQARKSVPHGLQATLTPMRFEGGKLTTTRRRRQYTVQRVFDDRGREMLYLLSFYLPRFLNHSLEEKLITVIHELWHISPQFDGDIRRHEGRCYAHTGSQKAYDAAMARLAGKWLSLNPPRKTYAFLETSFGELTANYGSVYGVKIPAPKLIPQ